MSVQSSFAEDRKGIEQVDEYSAYLLDMLATRRPAVADSPASLQ
jgi:hypothetical protein